MTLAYWGTSQKFGSTQKLPIKVFQCSCQTDAIGWHIRICEPAVSNAFFRGPTSIRFSEYHRQKLLRTFLTNGSSTWNSITYFSTVSFTIWGHIFTNILLNSEWKMLRQIRRTCLQLRKTFAMVVMKRESSLLCCPTMYVRVDTAPICWTFLGGNDSPPTSPSYHTLVQRF